jgi:glycosyltransferase involved in cell wall biosynthesis
MHAESEVLVLNQYVPPDVASTGRFAFEVARALAGDGHRVTFVAGQPSYLRDQSRAPRREVRDGVEIRRVAILGSRIRAHRARRAAGWLAYVAGATAIAVRLRVRRRIDIVICFHNPPFLPLVAAALSGRRRKFVCAVMDIFPDIMLATTWLSLPRPVVAIWNALNRWAFGRATTVVVISEGMKARLASKGVEREKIVVLPVWAEPELTPSPKDRAARMRHGVDNGELMLLFTGNMGVTQQLEPVARAARRLVDAPVRFYFVASDVHASRWRERMAGLPNVVFLPFQSELEYRALIAACDAGIVTLAPGLEQLVVPSRAFPLLSAGIPLLAVMSPESDVGALVLDYECGACVSTEEDLVEVVSAWLGDRDALRTAGINARAAYEARRGRDAVLRGYAELLRSR